MKNFLYLVCLQNNIKLSNQLILCKVSVFSAARFLVAHRNVKIANICEPLLDWLRAKYQSNHRASIIIVLVDAGKLFN